MGYDPSESSQFDKSNVPQRPSWAYPWEKAYFAGPLTGVILYGMLAYSSIPLPVPRPPNSQTQGL